MPFHWVVDQGHFLLPPVFLDSQIDGSTQAATSVLRGRPRGLLRGTIWPRKNSSPPHTPQGSRRSMAPDKHAILAAQPTQSAFAVSTSSGDSAKNGSGSSVQGSRVLRAAGTTARMTSVRPDSEYTGSGADTASNPAAPAATAVVPGPYIVQPLSSWSYRLSWV